MTNGGPLACVVDASVGVKQFVAEPLSDRAEALFAQLAADPPALLYVPDLFYIECTNTLWKHVRRFGYDPARARRDVRDLHALALRSVSTAELITPALDIALAHSITAYDACYIALAQELHVPFITADERLAALLAAARFNVQVLADFPLPPA